MSRGLTPKRARFVEEYLRDVNATQAALRAGYAESGARTEGARLLANADIQEAIAVAQAERSRRTRIDADDVLRILYDEARGIGPDTASSARIRAAELLGKNLGMFVDRLRVEGALTFDDLIDRQDRWMRSNGKTEAEIEAFWRDDAGPGGE